MTIILALITGYLLGQVRTEHRIAANLASAQADYDDNQELTVPVGWMT